MAIQFVRAVGAPGAISQTFDNIFHLNAVRYIWDTNQASSFTLGSMTGERFYPAAWHDVVSLVGQLGHLTIPVAVNVSNLVICSVIWVSGCMLFSRLLLPRNLGSSLVVGVFSAGFGTFPLMMIDFGVLYPTLLAYALVPATLWAGMRAIGCGDSTVSVPLARFLLLLLIPGLGLAHPTGFLVVLALLSPVALFRIVAGWREFWATWSISSGLHWARAVVVVMGIIGMILIWTLLRPPAEAAFWPPIHSLLGAAAVLASGALMGLPPNLLGAAAILLGLFTLWRRRSLWWLLGQLVVAVGLFVVVSSFQQGRVRDIITGPWYNDSYRLAALLPIILVPVASAGVYWTASWILASPRAKAFVAGLRLVPSRKIATAVVLTALGVAASQLGSVNAEVLKASKNYALSASSPLLTTDEVAVLQQVDSLVPSSAVVAGNPGNGSSLVFAIANRKPLQYHILAVPPTADVRLILDHLADAGSNPEVCNAVRRLGVTYVLDFGAQEVNNGSHPTPGLRGLVAAGVARSEFQQGSASLLKLTACG
nr:DUF6541 family protein [Psychromicrobium sp. YIM S02556]